MKIEQKKEKSKFMNLGTGDVFIYNNKIYMKIQEAELYNMNHINGINVENGSLEFFDKGTEITYLEDAVIKL